MREPLGADGERIGPLNGRYCDGILLGMVSLSHIDELPRAAQLGVRELAASKEVSFILLFGSRARGQAGPMSDVDLAVALVSRNDDPTDVKLRYLPRLSGPDCAVDLVVLETAPIALRFRIARDSLPLWVGDPRALHNFKVAAHRDWLDYEPMLRSHAAALRRRIAEGRFATGAPGAPRHG